MGIFLRAFTLSENGKCEAISLEKRRECKMQTSRNKNATISGKSIALFILFYLFCNCLYRQRITLKIQWKRSKVHFYLNLFCNLILEERPLLTNLCQFQVSFWWNQTQNSAKVTENRRAGGDRRRRRREIRIVAKLHFRAEKSEHSKMLPAHQNTGWLISKIFCERNKRTWRFQQARFYFHQTRFLY